MKKHIVASMILLGAFGVQAADSLYITGATAFRRDLFNALFAKLTNTVGFAVGPAGVNSGTLQYQMNGTWPADGSAAQNKNVNIFVGVTGSAQGISDVANPSAVVTFKTLANVTFTSKADVAFSDAYQESTDSSAALGFTDLSGTDTPVAVQPFVFAKNSVAGANVVNMHPQTFINMGGPGFIAKSFFTGVAADSSARVYLVGRNAESGTRIVTLAETGYGITVGIKQWRCGTLSPTANADGSFNRVANQATFTAWPSIVGIQSGWNSGGSVAADLNNNTVADAAVGYLSAADVGTIPQLTYNGSAYTKDNVRNGKYTLWGYEHFYSRIDLDATNPERAAIKSSIVDMLGTYEATAASAAGIDLNSMNVARGSDGGLVQ